MYKNIKCAFFFQLTREILKQKHILPCICFVKKEYVINVTHILGNK